MAAPSDPFRYFRIEGRELLEGLGQGLADLEAAQGDSAVVNRLLRLAHTLKGAARVVKQLEIAQSAHHIEELLSPFREGQRAPGAALLSELQRAIDGIAGSIEGLGPHTPSTPAPKPGPAVSAEPPADDAFRTVRVDIDEMNDHLRAITEAGVQLAALKRELSELGAISGLASALVRRLQLKRRGEHLRGTGEAADAVELGLGRDLESSLERATQALADRTGRAAHELEEVRQGAERLRLIPVSTIGLALGSAARDAAQTLGREVTFELEGGALRLDAQMLAPLRDALVHLVRNAVAHGIEPSTERVAAGKPAGGLVRVAVLRRGNEVVASCVDDGRGVDVGSVRDALVARGLIEPSDTLAPGVLLERLKVGGLTTSREVTHLSGRGIGLDVARETAARLKGRLELESEPGRGTRVALRVPGSLASLKALLVEAGGVTAALPLEAITRSLRVLPEDLQRSVSGDILCCAGVNLPFIGLSWALKRERGPTQRHAGSAVLVEVEGRGVALGVDALLGTTDIVVRPVPPGVAIDPVVSGVTLDVEGNPRLVLDPKSLVDLAGTVSANLESPRAPRPPILVIDDSLTTRMLEQSILESVGYQVELAVSAEDGLEKARNKRYAVFLVDVEMPGMDGFEFVSLTRADPELSKVPAILVTSRHEPGDLERGRRAGAADYIVKGEFDQQRLLSTIERLTAG